MMRSRVDKGMYVKFEPDFHTRDVGLLIHRPCAQPFATAPRSLHPTGSQIFPKTRTLSGSNKKPSSWLQHYQRRSGSVYSAKDRLCKLQLRYRSPSEDHNPAHRRYPASLLPSCNPGRRHIRFSTCGHRLRSQRRKGCRRSLDDPLCPRYKLLRRCNHRGQQCTTDQCCFLHKQQDRIVLY